MSEIKVPDWGAVCVKLLQGPIFETNNLWKTFEYNFREINEYFNKIGLAVFWDKGDGYALLKQLDDDSILIQENGNDVADDERVVNEFESLRENFPHLIRRQPLTFEQSLLCVLLREDLDKFDSSQSHSAFLTMRESEIKERLLIFQKETNDKVKAQKSFLENIARLEKLSYIEELPESKKNTSQNKDREFRILPILKAKVTLDFLEEFKNKLLSLKNGDRFSLDDVESDFLGEIDSDFLIEGEE